MSTTSENNKRIAKNTLFLYFRTLLVMLVSLYMSRVVLDTLGVEDYGIYNVVGGIVTFFNIISSSLSGAISRFITIALGEGDRERLRRIFSTSVSIQIGMAIIVFIVSEIVGVWFLNTQMNIAADRLDAANWVLQCSILTFVVNLMSIPYNAMIVAHEQMKVFAYISVLDVLLKLGVAFSLYLSWGDSLKMYAVLLLGVALLIRCAYGLYCKCHFEECFYQFVLDKGLLVEMGRFAGWSLIPNTAYLLNTQGVNMLINIYFGVTLNAARAVATQVEIALGSFVSNFTVALNPPITKAYAMGERTYMIDLICKGTRYSFFIVYLCVVPLVLEAETILSLWLKHVPEQAVVFTRLAVFSTLMMQMGSSMLVAILATGNIRRYQISVTLIGSMVFPLSWFAYRTGFPASSTYMIFIVIYFLLNFVRLVVLKQLVDFPVFLFLRVVMLKLGLVSLCSFILPGVVFYGMAPSFMRLLLVVPLSLLSTCACIYLMGLESGERMFLRAKLSSFFNQKFRNNL